MRSRGLRALHSKKWPNNPQRAILKQCNNPPYEIQYLDSFDCEMKAKVIATCYDIGIKVVYLLFKSYYMYMYQRLQQ